MEPIRSVHQPRRSQRQAGGQRRDRHATELQLAARDCSSALIHTAKYHKVSKAEMAGCLGRLCSKPKMFGGKITPCHDEV